MKLGIFMPTMRNGWTMSTASPQFTPDWALMRDVGERAEDFGFDFLLAPVKLRGLGGATRHWDDTLDSLAVMTGLALTTERVKLYASVATLTTPPALTARQVATVAEMAGGRFGLNVVTGWEKPEYTQMGLWPGDSHFTTRYDHAGEYVQVMRDLWTTGRSNFKGDYFQMDDCKLGPLPGEHVEIVCAGSSDRGMRFCAEYGDYNFVIGDRDAAKLTQTTERLAHASQAAGRRVGALPLFRIVVRDSTDEARSVLEDWRAHQDLEAVAELTGHAVSDLSSQDANAHSRAMLGSDTFLFSIPTIFGDAASVAQEIQTLAGVSGVAGMMFLFGDYTIDLNRFGSEVVPLLK